MRQISLIILLFAFFQSPSINCGPTAEELAAIRGSAANSTNLFGVQLRSTKKNGENERENGEGDLGNQNEAKMKAAHSKGNEGGEVKLGGKGLEELGAKGKDSGSAGARRDTASYKTAEAEQHVTGKTKKEFVMKMAEIAEGEAEMGALGNEGRGKEAARANTAVSSFRRHRPPKSESTARQPSMPQGPSADETRREFNGKIEGMKRKLANGIEELGNELKIGEARIGKGKEAIGREAKRENGGMGGELDTNGMLGKMDKLLGFQSHILGEMKIVEGNGGKMLLVFTWNEKGDGKGAKLLASEGGQLGGILREWNEMYTAKNIPRNSASLISHKMIRAFGEMPKMTNEEEHQNFARNLLAHLANLYEKLDGQGHLIGQSALEGDSASFAFPEKRELGRAAKLAQTANQMIHGILALLGGGKGTGMANIRQNINLE